jgi:hypothetical protein
MDRYIQERYDSSMAKHTQKRDALLKRAGEVTAFQKHRPLTPKEARFVAALPTAKSAAAAARTAGYADGRYGVSNETYRLKSRGPVREAIRDLLRLSGVDEQAVAQKLRHGLEAQKVELSKDGTAVNLGPDWATRYKFAELAAKALNVLPDPRLEVSGPDGGAIVVRHTPTLD